MNLRILRDVPSFKAWKNKSFSSFYFSNESRNVPDEYAKLLIAEKKARPFSPRKMVRLVEDNGLVRELSWGSYLKEVRRKAVFKKLNKQDEKRNAQYGGLSYDEYLKKNKLWG